MEKEEDCFIPPEIRDLADLPDKKPLLPQFLHDGAAWVIEKALDLREKRDQKNNSSD